MASRKSKNREAGIEFLLGLVFVLIDRAREWGDVKPNVFWEYGCWIAVTGLLLRIFWILQWTEKWKRVTKLTVVAVVPLFLVVLNWQPARSKYLAQNMTKPDPLIPWIEIKTQNGLSGPMPGGEITGEMVQTFRQQRLFIKNPNNTDLRNFVARLQLPEPVSAEIPPSVGPIVPHAPPGVHIQWSAEPSGLVSFSSGTASVKSLGPRRQKAEWILGIDNIPAFAEIQVLFLTVSRTNTPAHLGLTDANSHALENYLDGSFQFFDSGAWRTQEVVMPILFDLTTRTIQTLPADKPRGIWKRTVRHTGP